MALTGLVAWAFATAPILAQPANVGRPLPGINPFFRVGPNLTLAQAAFNTSVMGQAFQNVPPYALGFNPYLGGGIAPPVAAYSNPFINPGLYTNPGIGYANPYGASMTAAYGTPPGYDPYSGYTGSSGSYYGESVPGGYLRGAADVINAQGRFVNSLQERDLKREQVYRERLENKKRALDTYLYLLKNTPTPEDMHQAYLKQAVRRMVNDPSVNEIYSGQALNLILDDLRKANKDRSLRGPQIDLDEDVVRHVNLSKGGSDNNAGLLKRANENERQISWPLLLKDPEYKNERQLLNTLVKEALKQAVDNRVDPGTYNEISAAVERLQQQLASNIRDLPPNQYMQAKRFLSNFADSLKVLQKPDAGDYFSDKYTPKAKSVGDLVKFMLAKGLQFAPAVEGDEAAYVALHRALSAYHGGANPQLTADRDGDRP
jgi:hypothetical protein